MGQQQDNETDIFCVPHPMKRTEDSDLPSMPITKLDSGYLKKVAEIREYIDSVVPLKRTHRGALMTCGMLANLLTQVVHLEHPWKAWTLLGGLIVCLRTLASIER